VLNQLFSKAPERVSCLAGGTGFFVDIVGH